MSTLLQRSVERASRRRFSRSAVAAAVALIAAGCLWLALQARASSTSFEAGLVFTNDACDLSPGFALSLGGPLTPRECARVERIARDEVDAAFAALRLQVTASSSAFWTVHVRPFVPARSRTLGAAGASLAFGPLGGRGTVGMMPLAAQAMRHAPIGTSREQLVAAIGLGVGRSVVHEFAHQIAGGAVDSSDAATYEYASIDRPSQYYGTLHWGAAGSRIRLRLSR